MSVGALDDHVLGGGDEDAGAGFRVSFEEPDGNGDVVGNAMEDHGDGALGLQQMDGGAVVMHEGGRPGAQAREVVRQVEQVLPDEQLHVLVVGERVGAALR